MSASEQTDEKNINWGQEALGMTAAYQHELERQIEYLHRACNEKRQMILETGNAMSHLEEIIDLQTQQIQHLHRLLEIQRKLLRTAREHPTLNEHWR